MKTTRKEAAALARVNAAADGEEFRENVWHAMPIHERQRAVALARLPSERAAMPLASFNDHERERIRAAVSNHVAQMEMVMRLMVGVNTNRAGYLH